MIGSVGLAFAAAAARLERRDLVLELKLLVLGAKP